jgi:imidazolonepropionase-like amidohydrolase
MRAVNATLTGVLFIKALQFTDNDTRDMMHGAATTEINVALHTSGRDSK